MEIVGITGLMGSGKSYIADQFSKLGAIVYNTDNISKKLQVQNQELMLKIIEKFGDEYYTSDNPMGLMRINKEYAINKLFDSTPECKENLRWMTETVGSFVLEHLMNYKRSLEDAGNKGFILVESAILFETGLNKLCRYVIGVKSTNPVVATMRRDNITKEEWQNRMSTQLPEDQKKYDFVIGNDYTNRVDNQVVMVYEKLLSLCDS